MTRATAILCTGLACSTAEAVPDGFEMDMLTDQLDLPVGLAVLPDGRILITEQASGEIRVFADGALQPDPVATVATLGPIGCGESGLLGIAPHPDFADNGYFYVYYTNADDTHHVVSRFTMVGDTASGETPILYLDPTSNADGNSCANHNGGYLAFGPDGYLYVTNGERCHWDCFGSADFDTTSSLLGKVLRVTESGAPAPGNPFGNEVFTMGHRNSYGIAFHATTGELYETENGPTVDDEINHLVAGDDYGWPHDTGDNASAAFHDPIHVYPSPICVTGISSYGGGPFPDPMDGDLFYADCKTGHIHRMRVDAADPETVVEVDETFAQVDGATIDVKWNPADGALYFTAMRYQTPAPGRLYRIRYPVEPPSDGGDVGAEGTAGGSGCGCQIGARP
jgi:glucose/arabinose dehydrogenase